MQNYLLKDKNDYLNIAEKPSLVTNIKPNIFETFYTNKSATTGRRMETIRTTKANFNKLDTTAYKKPLSTKNITNEQKLTIKNDDLDQRRFHVRFHMIYKVKRINKLF